MNDPTTVRDVPSCPAAGALARVAARAATRVALAVLVAGLGVLSARAQDAPAGGRGSEGFDEDRGTQVYALNASRECEGLADQAQEALERGRLPSAFATFERLLETYPTQVLPPRFAADRAGHYPHYVGVRPWIARRLDELGPAARQQWIERSADDASALLSFALAERAPVALFAAARRFPRTPQAARAWLAIGDLRLADGRLVRARGAWEAAREDAGDDASLGRALDARFDALARLESLADDRARTDAALPTGPLQRWTAELDADGPFARSWPASAPFALQAVSAKDRLWVNTSLSLVCFDLLSGERLWSTPEPDGWQDLRRRERSDYFTAIEFVEARVRPALVGGAVVCAQQLPTASQSNYDFQGITVTRAIPERRLFAFDATSGAPLWNHDPRVEDNPALGDSGIGAYSVAAPPTVADGSILVPLARVQGRIELRLACIDPADGRVIWNTRVVSGQRALNMFNRHEEEFWAAPVTVAGTRAILCTQLGSVACLDLESGAVLWQSTYEPIPLPRTSNMWNRATRHRVWRNTAPVVHDGMVFATPTDSEDLLAIELDSGRVDWSRSHSRLSPRRGPDGSLQRSEVDTLLGAVDVEGAGPHVLLAGDAIVAWSYADEENLPEGEVLTHLPRDVVPQAYDFAAGPLTRLVGERLLVPSEGGLFVHALDGEQLTDEEIDWDDETIGNVLVTSGALVSVRGDRVTAFLDLELLEARTLARLAVDPRDPRALETFGRLHLRRAELAREAGDTARALEHHAEVREALDPVLADARTLAALFAEAVRAEASLLAASGEHDDAAALLGDAAERVQRDDLVLDLLLALARLERGRRPQPFESALTAIEARVPGVSVPAAQLDADPAWSTWLEGRDAYAVDASLWVAVQRAFAAEAAGDAAGAVAAWQRCLERYAAAPVARERQVSDVGGAAIERWLTVDPDAYAPFERAAQSELDAARAGDDLDRLDALCARYPFAEAADEARALALDIALRERDLAETLARARAATAGGARWTNARRVALARLCDASGNRSLAAALLRDIAERAPDWRASTAGLDGMSARQVLETLELDELRPEPAVPTFGDRVKLDQSMRGPYDELGTIASAHGDEAGRQLLLHRRGQLERVPLDGSGSTSKVPFEGGRSFSFPGPRQRALAPEGFVWMRSGRVYATDLSTGRTRWEWPPSQRTGDAEFVLAQEVSASDGVAVLTIYRAGQRHAGAHNALVALELVTGEALWEIDLPDGQWMRPVIAGGRVAVVERGVEGPSRGVAVDLVSGRERVVFDLPEALDSRDAERMDARDGRLIVPLFDRGAVVAIELSSGATAWRRDLVVDGGPSSLFAILSHGEALFAVAAPTDIRRGAGAALLEIEPRTGGSRVVERLDPEEVLIGVPAGAWVELDAPWLFTLWHDGASADARLSALALPLGRRWTQRLRLTSQVLGDVSRAKPAVSERFAAIVWSTVDRDNRRPDPPRLGFFDLESGLKTAHRLLTSEFAYFDAIELRGYGDVLWLVCSDLDNESSERIELWK